MASGDTLVSFSATDNHPPATVYATITVRNSHPILNFDPGTDEHAIFASVLPRNYAGGGLTVTVTWMAATATSGNVIWNAAIERDNTAGPDLDTDDFATAQAASASAASGTCGILTAATIAFTSGAQMDSLAAGETFRLKITRDADNGSDTMAGDAQLVSVEVKET